MRYFVNIGGDEHQVDVDRRPDGAYDVLLDADGTRTKLDADVVDNGGVLSVRLDGQVFDLVVDGALPNLDVFASGRRASVLVESTRTRAAGALRGGADAIGSGTVLSPMPGKVVKVLVKEGDQVEPGTPVVVVEAMKMENELAAETPGVVEKIHVSPGDAVEGGAKLVSVA